jgi:hypothetical protein
MMDTELSERLSARRIIAWVVYIEVEVDFQLPIPEHGGEVIGNGWKIAFHDGSCREFGKVVGGMIGNDTGGVDFAVGVELDVDGDVADVLGVLLEVEVPAGANQVGELAMVAAKGGLDGIDTGGTGGTDPAIDVGPLGLALGGGL